MPLRGLMVMRKAVSSLLERRVEEAAVGAEAPSEPPDPDRGVRFNVSADVTRF